MSHTGTIIDRSIPRFVRDQYPMFETFLQAYYDWMQEQKNSLDIVNNFDVYGDIDRTLDEFVDHFHEKYLKSFPKDILADKRLLVKHIRKFYIAKGTENSFRLLFKLLYGTEVEFYYPKDDILRADDGKWQQLITIKVRSDQVTDPYSLFNTQIVGETSGANAYVESILTYEERGIPVYELSLTNLYGQFVEDENLLANGDIITQVLEVLSGVNIISGGTGYSLGDNVTVKDDGNVKIATGRVSAVGRGPVTGLNLINGGIGYRGELRQVETFEYLPMDYEYMGITLEEWLFGGDSNTPDLDSMIFGDPIIPVEIPDTGDIITITDTPSQVGTGAIGIVSLVAENGEILDIDLVAGGKDYNIPVAHVTSQTGSGAIVEAVGGGGSIKRITLDSFPIFIPDSNGEDNLTFEVDTENGVSANLAPIFDSGMSKYAGRWINDDGMLDSTKVLEDSNYYQEYSYDLVSEIAFDKWKDIIKKIGHPSGTKMFGSRKFMANDLATSAELESVFQED